MGEVRELGKRERPFLLGAIALGGRILRRDRENKATSTLETNTTYRAISVFFCSIGVVYLLCGRLGVKKREESERIGKKDMRERAGMVSQFLGVCDWVDELVERRPLPAQRLLSATSLLRAEVVGKGKIVAPLRFFEPRGEVEPALRSPCFSFFSFSF